MARTVSVRALQDMQRESAVGEASDAEPVMGSDEWVGKQRRAAGSNGRGPGFQDPAVPVADQLQALVLQDDISGMPLGQVVGLVRIAVAEAHVNATETEIRDEAERRWGEPFTPIIEPNSDDRAEQDEDESGRMSFELQALNIGASLSEEMSLGMVIEEVRIAAERAGLAPLATDAEIVAEGERIWGNFAEQRKGPRVADVNPDGTVSDWRRPDITPDRGPDVGTTVHTVSDDEPRFSGAGASDGPEPSKLVPTDQQFNGKGWRTAPELAQMAADLIEEHGYLEHLQHCRIAYFWQRKSGTADRQRVLSILKRGSGHYGQLIDAEFAVYVAADTARERHHTDRHVSRSVFRQIRRIGQDDKGNWIQLPFTIQVHAEEILKYADLNDEDLRVNRNAHRNAEQMGLFATDDDDEREDDGAGVLIHTDGTALTDDEIEAMQRHELADDDGDDVLADCSICGKPIEPGQVVSHLFTAEGEARRHMACRYDAADSGASDEDEKEDILADPAVI